MIYRIYGKGRLHIDVDEETAETMVELGVLTYTGEGIARSKRTGDTKTIYKYRRASNEEYLVRPIPTIGV